jgi:diguanylate cyclase (GGDEF)-like protein
MTAAESRDAATPTSERTSALPPGSMKCPLKVLIVDDHASAQAALVAAIRHLGHSCRVARDGSEALALHEAEPADVILSDWSMPTMDGFELCKAIRARDLAKHGPKPYVYFVFVTAHGDKAHCIEGMHAGADDYLVKPIDLDELDVRLEAAQRVVTRYRQLETSNARLRRDSARFFRDARTDALTAVSNRRRLTEDLDVLGSRASRYGHRYCAALYDVDRFKAYNDAFGHVAGDEVLRRVARTIRSELRRSDSFYRYGGEEFLAILPEQSIEQAVAVTERVRGAVEQLQIPHAPAASLPFVTVSAGVAELKTGSNGDTEGWLARADQALYVAKGRGRNRVEQ